MSECLVCREVAGEIELPGGPLIDGEHVVAFHVMPTAPNPRPYLGHLMAVTRRHAAGFEDLTEPEAAALGVATSVLARGLRSVGATHVHTARIGTGVPHMHVHVLPRWPETPADVPWNEVDEWDGARRGDVKEIEALVVRIADGVRTK